MFGPDGMIYMTINDHDKNNAIDDPSIRIFAQHLDSDVGKVLRIRDDGSIPPDNPFVGREDANGQVFTYGHRNTTDFAWHPTTGELWATEIGPMGGDEINILRAGQNYGWPLVSLGRLYTKGQVSEQHWYREGMEMPFMYWTPSISPNSLVWYTGRQARAVARQPVRRRAERPDAAAHRVRSAAAAVRAARFVVHVARAALAPRRAEPGRLSLRRDGEAHAGNAARPERRDERRRLPHRAGRLSGGQLRERNNFRVIARSASNPSASAAPTLFIGSTMRLVIPLPVSTSGAAISRMSHWSASVSGAATSNCNRHGHDTHDEPHSEPAPAPLARLGHDTRHESFVGERPIGCGEQTFERRIAFIDHEVTSCVAALA